MSDPPRAIDDVIDDLFGGGSKREVTGRDVTVRVPVELIDVAHGTTRTVDVLTRERCVRCSGLGGREGAIRRVCTHCDGSGMLTQPKGILRVRRTCSACHGRGDEWSNPCPDCRGTGTRRQRSTIDITIPPGTPDGAVLRLAGRGHTIDGSRGDVLATIDVTPHHRLVRDGDDLRVRVWLGASPRAGTTRIAWLDGYADVPRPADAKGGDELRLRGWGCVRLGHAYAPPPGAVDDAPYRSSGAARGDLVVTLVDDAMLAQAYRTLDLSREASREDVELAFRRLSLANHPDRHPDREAASRRFSAVAEAYADIVDLADPPAAVPTSRVGSALVMLGVCIASLLALALLQALRS
jgi:DnaJ-class molecular chaperone